MKLNNFVGALIFCFFRCLSRRVSSFFEWPLMMPALVAEAATPRPCWQLKIPLGHLTKSKLIVSVHSWSHQLSLSKRDSNEPENGKKTEFPAISHGCCPTFLSDLQKAAREREGELNHPSSLYEACNGGRNGTASSDVIREQRQRKSRNERRERVKNGSPCQCHAASYRKIGRREITQ